MKSAKLTINLSNAAFEDDLRGELRDIFLDLADRIMYGKIQDPYIIRDSNGNKVGELRIEN